MSSFLRHAAVLVGFGLVSCVFVVDADGHGPWGGGVRGSGVRSEEVRQVEAFHSVRLKTSANVKVRVGEAPTLVLSGDDNVVPEVRTRVEGGTLVIDLPGSWRMRRDLEVSLTTPTLEGFRIEGSGEVTIDGVTAEHLELAIEGSGELVARGSARDLRGTIEGSGSLDLAGLTAERAELEIDGSGAIEAAVTSGLHYSIEGSGSIVYTGAPTTHGTIDGSGNLVRRK